MKVQLVDIDTVEPYHNNPRKNAKAVESVALSIKEFGFRQPIVVDKHNVIIVGHTRWKAAKELNIKKVPIHVADLTAKAAKAYRIADNKTNEAALWDVGLLEHEIDELGDGVFTGFQLKELDSLFKRVDEIGVQDVPEHYEVIIVEVPSSEVQKDLFNEMTGRGFKCRLVAI